MHDPSSYEHINTTYRLTKNNSIIVSTKFRGKKPLGALIMQTYKAEFDIEGNIYVQLKSDYITSYF